MKEDKLEKTIRENREYFDNREPSRDVWTNVAFRLGINRSTSANIWWRVAAIIFFGLSAYLLTDKLYQEPQQEPVVIDDRFAETESFYLDEIEQKTELITQFTDQVALGEQAERDLQRLDAMYQVLKEKYKKDPSKEVVDALILNLLLHLDILNDELEKLDKQEETAVSI